MSTQNIVLIAIMALMLIGVGVLIFRFIQSIRARRAYEKEELPDIYEAEVEDVVLPDIEESGFSQLGVDYGAEEESAADIYHDIYEEGSDRRTRQP